jgi:selenocysteine-specific elongation factor
MLAGVGGIDAALLVIAADEGVMPQTREHLAILDLLEIPTGVVALTKIDLVDDDEWLALVEGDIRALLAGTALADASIMRVSARTRFGLDELTRALSAALKECPPRLDYARPRLPIDRVFSMPGFGTVVTGTLGDGHLSVGDEVEILPAGLRGRVRGLQTHNQKEETALPGTRTAVNISGLAVEQIARGQVLASPAQYQPTRRVDARVRLVKDLEAPLKHASQVKVFAGTAEVMAGLRILGADMLNAGDEGWIQLELRDALVLVRGDRIILRRPSPGETLGGGRVIDPNPRKRHRRFDDEVLAALEAMALGSPAEILFQAALALGPATVREVSARARLEAEDARQALQECLASGMLLALDGDENTPIQPDALLLPAPLWQQLKGAGLAALAAYHQSFPLRRGMPREELKSRLKLTARVFNAFVRRLDVQDGGAWLALPGHAPRFSPDQQAAAAALMKKFSEAPFMPPSVKECQAGVGEDVFAALLDLGELCQVSPEVVFRPADLEQMKAQVSRVIAANGQVTAGEVRDLFATSRKFALALLEHLDKIGVTIRDGDVRRLR